MGLQLAQAFISVRGDASKLSGDLNAAKPGVENAAASLQSAIGGIQTALFGVAAAMAAIKGLDVAGKFEQTTIAFETMIGSAEETQQVLADLTEFAAKTPFEMPQIEMAARGLIMFGERGDELMETLNILGDASAGTGTDFGMLALIFNQVRGVGKLLTQDFRQLTTRGVLTLQDLAAYFGVTTAAAQDMVSKGEVSFEDLRNILKKASEEGGRFANLMEKQSTSYLGLTSTLKDNIGLVVRAMGEALLPIAKKVVSFINKLADAVREWINNNRVLFGTFVKIGTAIGLLFTMLGTIIAIKVAVLVASGAFATMWASIIGPAGIAVVAVAALGVALVQLYGEGDTFGEKMEDIFKNKIPSVMKGAEFAARHLGLTFELAAVDISIAFVKFIYKPLDEILGKLPGVVGAFAGMAAGIQAWLENIGNSFLNLKNQLGALTAGFAAWSREIMLGNFKGAGQEFADAYNSAMKMAVQPKMVDIEKRMRLTAKNVEAGMKIIMDAMGLGGAADLLDELRAERERIALELVLEEIKMKQEEDKEKKEKEEPPPEVSAKGMAGRYGFLEYSKKLQDMLLKGDDPAKKTAKNTEKANAQLEDIKDGVRKLAIIAPLAVFAK